MFCPSSCPPVGVHTHLRLHQRWFRHSMGVSTRLLVDLLGFGERQTHGTLTYEPLHRPLAPFRTIVLWPWVVQNSSGAFSTTRHCHLQLCMATSLPFFQSLLPWPMQPLPYRGWNTSLALAVYSCATATGETGFRGWVKQAHPASTVKAGLVSLPHTPVATTNAFEYWSTYVGCLTTPYDPIALTPRPIHYLIREYQGGEDCQVSCGSHRPLTLVSPSFDNIDCCLEPQAIDVRLHIMVNDIPWFTTYLQRGLLFLVWDARSEQVGFNERLAA